MEEVLGLHKKRHITMVFVSHNMDDIARLADKVIFMNQGRVVLYDTPAKAFREKECMEEAGLRPPQIMSFLEELRAAGLPVDTNALTLEQGVSNILRAMKGKG